jgi:hypothetical protein
MSAATASVRRVKRIARRLAFNTPPTDGLPSLVNDPTVSLFIFFKRRAGMKRSAFFDQLAGQAHQTVLAQRDALRFNDYHQYHDASRNGLLTASYMFSRSYRCTAVLLRLLGEPVPDRYDVQYRPTFDAVLELTFPAALDSNQVRAVKELVAQLEPSTERVAYVHSALRRRLKEHESTKNSVYLIEFLRRLPSATRRQTQDYWIGGHGELVVSGARHLGWEEYQQVHAVDDSETTFGDEFDGFAWVRFPSLRHYVTMGSSPNMLRFNNALVADEALFLKPVIGLLVKEHPVTRRVASHVERTGASAPSVNEAAVKAGEHADGV